MTKTPAEDIATWGPYMAAGKITAGAQCAERDAYYAALEAHKVTPKVSPVDEADRAFRTHVALYADAYRDAFGRDLVLVF